MSATAASDRVDRYTASAPFPNCPLPPGQAQLHHVIDFADGGETSVNLAAPVCAMEHHQRVAEGWTAQVVGNRIAWVPPTSIDPAASPQYNALHLPRLTHPTDDE
jgi:hypothetical protein